ncbi:hypothetical protein GCM10009716_39860 [Streptomyces sodiiphilus]|uniref:Uncharacterized protein n=1 Tax=Streptomyces sodiiphilus TaxID=226217 RepID=A0ABN2PPL1_9ACTN
MSDDPRAARPPAPGPRTPGPGNPGPRSPEFQGPRLRGGPGPQAAGPEARAPRTPPTAEPPAADRHDTPDPVQEAAPHPPSAPADESERPRDAWAAAQELRDHLGGAFQRGGTYFTGGSPDFGDHTVLGDRNVLAGGTVEGGYFTGNTIHQYGTMATPQLQESGEIPAGDLDRLARVFHAGPAFEEALRQLLADRVVVLRGGHGTGRYTAALMLLRRAVSGRIRALDPESGPATLLKDAEDADGYVLRDLPTRRSDPLRQYHLLRCGERMRKQEAFLVVTVESSAELRGVRPVTWEPPTPAEVFAAHLRDRLTPDPEAGENAREDTVTGLLDEEPVREFVSTGRPVGEIAAFAVQVDRYHHGDIGAGELRSFGEETVREQVREWLSASARDEGTNLSLREKGFLIALSVCDKGPYPLTAELGDLLCRRMQSVESPEKDPGLEIFSTSLGQRLDLARATSYAESEETPWGPVLQTMIRFRDTRAAGLLIREAWDGHPAVRAPMSAWLTDLARHGNPFVRTRAGVAAAVLADQDLSSAMHGLLADWASGSDYRLSLQAANALALTASAGTPGVRRILRQWILDEHPRRRWTAVRAYALVGTHFPEETLDALEARARAGDLPDITALDDLEGGSSTREEFRSLVEAAELLLLSATGEQVPARLNEWCRHDSDKLRVLAYCALLSAARRRERPEEDPASRPLLLARYDEEPHGSPVRRELIRLWRHTLSDRTATRYLQDRLREWIPAAGRDPLTEAALARMLAALTVTQPDRDRLGYLLRTMPGEDGGPPPEVAGRLLRVLLHGGGDPPGGRPEPGAATAAATHP